MLYMLDTADLAAIRHCNEFYPLAGVTTNPSIIAKQNTDFWPLVEEIRAIIGKEKMLHVQVTEKRAEDIVSEAKLLKERLGGAFYANCGSTALPKDGTPHSYIFIDGNTLYLKDLETGGIFDCIDL